VGPGNALVKSTRPIPDWNSIPENLSNTMKRDHQHLTRFVFQLKRELVPFLEMDFDEGDADDLFCGMVQVSDLKIGCSEFFVPANSV
jgi:hypothetical protein